MKKFTKDTNLAEVLKYPELEKILIKYNLPCLACPLAKFEIGNLKIGEICKRYGINLESLLKELNEKLMTPWVRKKVRKL
jgi:hybrid cluster-associated redox disulfide protein